jgi:CheY-like chemotaxis protein
VDQPAPDSVDAGAAVGEAPVVELTYRSAGAFLVAYATSLVKGGLFVPLGDLAPLPVGAAVKLRLVAPPETVVDADGSVTWTRPAPAGPGQPAGMGVAIVSAPDALGAAVDRAAFGFAGVQVLLGTGEAAPRAIVTRYLRSILTCEILDVDYQNGGSVDLARVDLAVIDLDSSGPQGFDLHERLRGDAHAGAAPVLALAQLERDRARALRAGFDDALANPPVFADLQATVLRCLAKPVSVR